MMWLIIPLIVCGALFVAMLLGAFDHDGMDL